MLTTGSIDLECERRLTNLYTQSHNWLLQVAYKVTKHREQSEDIVSELYEYLHNKKNPALFWGKDSYNLLYCSKFIKHRYINKTKKSNRIIHCESPGEALIDSEYDCEMDLEIQKAHDDVIRELKRLSTTRMWPQAKIFELYWMSDDTLDEVANKIRISKSTTFLAVKKIRNYLKEVINNPFNEEHRN